MRTYKGKVLAVYPNTKIDKIKFGGDYIVNHVSFAGFGKTPKEAWKDAWQRIQQIMMRKLEQ